MEDTTPTAPARPALPRPPTLGDVAVVERQVAVAGQLTVNWRVFTIALWALALVGLLAVWKTSRDLGIHTWWLGPFGEPRPLVVSMLPFLPPLGMVLLAVNNARWIPWWGLLASGALALVGLLDLTTLPRLALVELAIAAAGALGSLAAIAGRYRQVELSSGLVHR